MAACETLRANMASSYKRMKGKGYTVQERISMHSLKFHATRQPIYGQMGPDWDLCTTGARTHVRRSAVAVTAAIRTITRVQTH